MTNGLRGPVRRPLTRRSGLAILIIVAAIVVTWLALRANDDHPVNPTEGLPAVDSTAVQATGPSLRKVAAVVGFPVYWAGRMAGHKIELTQTASTSVYIRYLPTKVAIGDPRPNFLTIATYPLPDAYTTARNAAQRAGTTLRRLPRRGIAFTSGPRTSAYFAYPQSRVGVEVYSPHPGRALRVILEGRIRAIQP